MREKVNLANVHPTKVLSDYIRPVLAREFLFMRNYEQFAHVVGLNFILTPDQWEFVLNEWDIKESILSA